MNNESEYQLKTGKFSSHGRLLEFFEKLPRTIRILDVGSASGYFGQALREIGFQNVTGIERNPRLASAARSFYESFVVSDIETDKLPWSEESFDVIVCADILEHLREPKSVLRMLSLLTKQGGFILISLPNIAHWSVRVSLLFGRFQYRASGILDKDHLRFFTRRTAITLINGASLRIMRERVTPLPVAHWCTNSISRYLWRPIELIDWCLARVRPQLFSYQFIYQCQRDN